MGNTDPMRSQRLSLIVLSSMVALIGTAQTPVLLKDINPSGNSNASFLTCIDGTIYFQANDGVHGAELWRSDGTLDGTLMVKDIQPGADGSFPRDFMAVNGTIYFTTNDLASGVRLWRTDGTDNGTQLVLTLADLPGLLEWMNFSALGDHIYFRGYETATGREIWRTDGTVNGTALFMDIQPGADNGGFSDQMVHDGHLYFRGNDGTNGSEPWISDGSVEGTHMIADVVPGVFSSSPSLFTAAGGWVFFRGSTSAIGDELFVTDGSSDGTYLAKDIYPGSNSSLPSFLTEYNGALHLRAFNFSGNYIWRSDGTPEGTVQVPMPANGPTLAENLCSHGGWLYFSGTDGTSRQLWRTNGTAEGTQELLLAGSDVAQPLENAGPMRSCNGDLFFRANYSSATGQEPYIIRMSTGMTVSKQGMLRLYPNPTASQLHVEGFDAGSKITLHAADGRLVLNVPCTALLDISAIPAGPYAARITDADGHVIHDGTIIIQH